MLESEPPAVAGGLISFGRLQQGANSFWARPLPQAVLTLLLRRLLGSRLITAAAAPNSIERTVGSCFVHYKSTTRAADAHRDVVASLDSNAVRIVTPNKVIEVAGGFDCQLHSVLLAVGVPASAVIFT